MTIRYLDVKYDSDDCSVGRLVRSGRVFTLVADKLTGVVERKEHPTYDLSVIRQWIGDSQRILLKTPTYGGWQARGPPYSKRFLIEGSPDEIAAHIENIRGWPSNEKLCSTQYLKYRDGRVQITVKDDSGIDMDFC